MQLDVQFQFIHLCVCAFECAFCVAIEPSRGFGIQAQKTRLIADCCAPAWLAKQDVDNRQSAYWSALDYAAGNSAAGEVITAS